MREVNAIGNASATSAAGQGAGNGHVPQPAKELPPNPPVLIETDI